MSKTKIPVQRLGKLKSTALPWALGVLMLGQSLLPGLLQAGAEQTELAELIVAAQSNNPSITAATAQQQVKVEQARQAGAWADPEMMVKIQNGLIDDPFSFTSDSATAKVIGLSQKLPFYGKRALARQEAEVAARAAQWQTVERQNELARMVKAAWYQLYLVDRSLESTGKNIDTIDNLSRLSETMYGIGKAGQQEVLRVQLERSQLANLEIDLQQQRASQVAALNSMAYRPMATAIPSIPVTTTSKITISATELLALAETHRPALHFLKTELERLTLGQQLAEKEVLPDFNLALEYMQLEPTAQSAGDDMYSVELSFNLPLNHDRRAAMLAETGAAYRQTAANLADIQNQISLAIQESLIQLDSSHRRAELYLQGLLPQAEKALESALAAYQTDTATFTEVLEREVALIGLENEYHQAVSQFQIRLAILEEVIGTDLPARSTQP